MDLELAMFWNGRSASYADSRASEVVGDELCGPGKNSRIR